MSPEASGRGPRIGILGGALNPPHLGHLLLAQEAHARLGLDRVLLVPVGEPPHREIAADPGGGERLRMARLAVGGDDRLAASEIEVERMGRSYTVDTLRALRDADPEPELTLILGADQGSKLRSWREPREVLALARVAVAEREGLRRDDVVAALAGLDGAEAVEGLELPRVDVSSTLVRERVAAGLPIRYLVPDGVADHIAARRLYTSPTAAPTA